MAPENEHGELAVSVVDPEQRLYSRGWLCEFFQLTPDELVETMQAAGVRFTLSLNCAAYVNHCGLKAIQDHLRGRKS